MKKAEKCRFPWGNPCPNFQFFPNTSTNFSGGVGWIVVKRSTFQPLHLEISLKGWGFQGSDPLIIQSLKRFLKVVKDDKVTRGVKGQQGLLVLSPEEDPCLLLKCPSVIRKMTDVLFPQRMSISQMTDGLSTTKMSISHTTERVLEMLSHLKTVKSRFPRGNPCPNFQFFPNTQKNIGPGKS